MLELLYFELLGIALGALTGLVPGLHVNTVVALILALLPALLQRFQPEALAGLIISMSVVHSYVDFIPSIFLGAPDEAGVLSVLPGHRLVLMGRGFEAVHLTVIGGLGATVLGSAFVPLGILLLPRFYRWVSMAVPYLLIGVLFYMVFIQNRGRRLYAALSVTYSAVLGMIILDLGVINLRYALFPALTGLFGASTLLISLRTAASLPAQTREREPVSWGRGVVIGSGAGLVAGLLPSIGSAQSATIIQGFFRDSDERDFLIAQGGVNTANSLYAFLALILIGRARSGAAMGVRAIMGGLELSDLLLLLGSALFSTFFAVAITLALAGAFMRIAETLEYGRVSKAILVFLTLLVLALTGWRGLLILFTSTAIGVFTQAAGVNRSCCMAVLMVPTALYLLSG